MFEIKDSNYAQMKSYVERNKFPFTESTEQNCKRLDVQHGKAHCAVKVYSTGTIQLQGTDSKLKEALNEAKSAVENEESIGEMLPFEIERFPELLKERIPTIDPVIIRFIEEAIVTVKAGSNLGCAFLLGGASERAILLLVDTYAKAIPDERMRASFTSRTSNKFIAKVFDEFKKVTAGPTTLKSRSSSYFSFAVSAGMRQAILTFHRTSTREFFSQIWASS